MMRRKVAMFVTLVALGLAGVATASAATTTTSTTKPPATSATSTTSPARATKTVVNGTARGHSTVGFGGTCADGQTFQHGEGTWQGAQTGKGRYKLDVCADVEFGDQITAKVQGTMRITTKEGRFDASVSGSGVIDLVNERATYDYTATVATGPHAGAQFHLHGTGKAGSIDFNRFVAHMADRWTYTGAIV
jgi:hypothetical protein